LGFLALGLSHLALALGLMSSYTWLWLLGSWALGLID
jgi:hypothetical protein